METILTGNKIVLGTCYYPEHWDESLWKDDLRRMKKHGIEAIRIAEFAWNIVEPSEGIFDYSFWDRFLDLALAEDMAVIFSTPTATPPAWLSVQFPEILNARMDGTLLRHGARRHYNYNSPVYRRFASRIVEKLAAHYGSHKAIIGWQIDNEINCETDEFYSGSDTAAFREFLKEKYGSLSALNKAWGTVFWNQTYTAWAELCVPGPTVSNNVNPHQVLDYIRFVSESARSFAKMQSDIIRKFLKKGDFITTNGIFGSLDNHRMNRESLDFYTYDSYPNFAYCIRGDPLFPQDPHDLNDRKWSRNLAELRSISPERFGIMEQQSGPNGSNTRLMAPSPRPGQMSLWALQSIAHGADYVSFFRWRTAVFGTEIYWHGILDYSNRDNRRLEELGELWKKTEKLSAAGLAGSTYQAAFAVVRDYDNIWDAKLGAWHRMVEKESEAGIFQAAQLCHSPMDYLYLGDSCHAEGLPSLSLLQRYPVLFYPHPVIMTAERAKLLEQYVEAGGTLVLGCRSGYKDPNGRCPMHKLPGLLQNLSGADIADFSLAAPDDGRITVDWDGTEIEAAVFNDIIESLDGAEILAAYKNGWYAGKGALSLKRHGRGKVYYFGGAFNRDTAKVFLEKLKIAEPHRDAIEVPPGCELAVRSKGKSRYYFVLNYERQPAALNLKREFTGIYTGTKLSGTVELPPYGVLVLQAEG
jgi:beta-galactosidase